MACACIPFTLQIEIHFNLLPSVLHSLKHFSIFNANGSSWDSRIFWVIGEGTLKIIFQDTVCGESIENEATLLNMTPTAPYLEA